MKSSVRLSSSNVARSLLNVGLTLSLTTVLLACGGGRDDARRFVTGSVSHSAWIWQGGSNIGNASGVYGAQGVAAATNVPGGRYGAASWTDYVGNFWLFGGYGTASNPNPGSFTTGVLNDLWELNLATGQWTWMSGANVVAAPGVYGTEGVAAPNNVPPARSSAVSWTDAAGNLWLFGGYGAGAYNDLWEYNPSTGHWTWMSGANMPFSISEHPAGAIGVYGTQGTAAPDNVPGARSNAVSFTDPAGNLWLFGGLGVDSAGNYGDLNDLWMYSPSTGQWTWMSGSSTQGASAIYGTQGEPAAGNVPSAREGAVSWTDAWGNFWLFGGNISGTNNAFNDLWNYSPRTGRWTWVSGSNTFNSSSVAGTKGIASPENVPGARANAASWTDMPSNLWLFSGNTGNDLWVYVPEIGEWVWMGGSISHTAVSAGIYGEIGIASSNNVPGTRFGVASWTDAAGNLWMFGGNGIDSAGNGGLLNDLWEYRFEP